MKSKCEQKPARSLKVLIFILIPVVALSITIWAVYKYASAATLSGQHNDQFQSYRYLAHSHNRTNKFNSTTITGRTESPKTSSAPAVSTRSKNGTSRPKEADLSSKKDNPTLWWRRKKDNICFEINDGRNFQIKKTGLYAIECEFAYKSTPNKNTFRVQLYLKRNKKTRLLASFEKTSHGPTKLWLYSNRKHFQYGDHFFFITNSSQYLKDGFMFVKPNHKACDPFKVDMIIV